MATHTAKRKPTISDLTSDGQRVICIEPFQPWMGRAINKGTFYRLGDEIVRQFPQYFAICVPVGDVLPNVIER